MNRVLVVDDDPSIRSVLRMALEEDGYAVEVESDGERAVALLRAKSTPLVVLLDLYMGGRQINPIIGALVHDPSLATAHAYVLMTAGKQQEADAALAPIAEYRYRTITKPFDLDELTALVAEAADALPDGSDWSSNSEGSSVLLAAG